MDDIRAPAEYRAGLLEVCLESVELNTRERISGGMIRATASPPGKHQNRSVSWSEIYD